MKFVFALSSAFVLMMGAACAEKNTEQENVEETAQEAAQEAVAVTLEDTTSLRVDIDAVVTFDSVTPVDGLTSAGQPTEQALQVFKNNGYSVVIDLRGPEEKRGYDERDAVVALGMEYVLLPIDSEDDVSFENAATLDELIASYEGPVLVHCASGNRVGALLALQKGQEGADVEAAIEYGKQGGLTRLEKHVRELLQAE